MSWTERQRFNFKIWKFRQKLIYKRSLDRESRRVFTDQLDIILYTMKLENMLEQIKGYMRKKPRKIPKRIELTRKEKIETVKKFLVRHKVFLNPYEVIFDVYGGKAFHQVLKDCLVTMWNDLFEKEYYGVDVVL